MGKKELTLLIIICFDFAFASSRDASGDDKIRSVPSSGTDKDTDCIDFYKQPAFDNPLLKNHTPQLMPSKDLMVRLEAKQNGSMNGFNKCPDGMVPIRRSKSGNPPQSFGLDYVDPSTPRSPDIQVASIHVYGQNYFGGSALVGIHMPRCVGNQMTGSFLRVIDRIYDASSNMYAGWAIYPQLYGNERPYLTIYWSNRAQGKGCFNTLCPGFVQVDKNVKPGDVFERKSVYDKYVNEATMEIRQDPQTKNWWFILDNINIGYWPKELFPNLEGGMLALFFGGIAAADENGDNPENNPEMGFGSFPGHDVKQAGYMRHIKYVDGSGNAKDPIYADVVETSPDCYKVGDKGQREFDGYIVLFGGPGGSKCPNSYKTT